MEPSTEKLPLIPMDAPLISQVVDHYLANRSMGQTIRWDDETGGYRYHVKPREGWHGRTDVKPEEVEAIRDKLPLVVPGLKVVKTVFREGKGYMSNDEGYIWFTWSIEALWERIAEIFEEHGVADERVTYMTTRGVEDVLEDEPRNPDPQQLRLPGVVEVAPRATGSVTSTGSIGKFWHMQSSWTAWGLQTIESGFIQRICHPNRGGPGAIPYRERVLVGNEWWYVGSRGDAAEILELEIQGSPLLDKAKMNLLENLASYSRDPKVRAPHTALD